MNIQGISSYYYINKPNRVKSKHTNFKSNREQELQLAELRRQMLRSQELRRQELRRQELQRQELRRQELERKRQFHAEYNKCMDLVDRTAQFALNFACSIKNNSNHDLEEFFGSEENAERLRKKLSPECQKNSILLRNEIQKQEVFQDPVLELMSANQMKEYIPDQEILSNSQIKEVIDATKKSYITAINNTNKSNFNAIEKTLIDKMTSIISKTEGVNFGEEFNTCLKKLISSVETRRNNVNKVFNQQKVINIVKTKI